MPSRMYTYLQPVALTTSGKRVAAAIMADGETVSRAPTPVALVFELRFSESVLSEEGNMGPATTPEARNAKRSSGKPFEAAIRKLSKPTPTSARSVTCLAPSLSTSNPEGMAVTTILTEEARKRAKGIEPSTFSLED